MKQWLKSLVPSSQRPKARRAINKIRTLLRPGDLKRLARYHGTDKWNAHWYAQHYERHFAQFRTRNVRLLEIGVGGE